MWGHIVLESYNHTLYNTGFGNQKASILLYLLKWQYFWWFWFSYLFILYYHITFNLVIQQSLKFNPRITTTLKAHGKWGDVIICFLPIFWCVNILTNSNTLLKAVEWQTESNSMLIRVRGKQWYWSYKIQLNSLSSLSDKNLIVGSSKKLVINNSDTNILSNSNLQKNMFWAKRGFFNYETMSCLKLTPYISTSNSALFSSQKNKNFNYKQFCFNNNLLSTQGGAKSSYFMDFLFFNKFGFLGKNDFILRTPFNFFDYTNLKLRDINNNLLLQKSISKQAYLFFQKKTLVMQDLLGVKQPKNISSYLNTSYRINNLSKLLFVKNPTNISLNANNLSLFNSNSFSKDTILLTKGFREELPILQFKAFSNKNELFRRSYITIKQEVLKEKLAFTASGGFDKLDLLETSIFDKYRTFKRKGFTLMNNRRLLNTKHLLTLPTKTNLTLITNSFDVVHSWFIPGLGLKMDCVPGRSTHHSLYIKTPGFYYGQCAEICGRLHHHMPIKICLLPVEHFFIWWNHFYTLHTDLLVCKYFKLQ